MLALSEQAITCPYCGEGVTVLVDGSGSTDTIDVPGESNVISRAEWINSHRATNHWGGLENIGQVIFDEFSPAPTNTNPDAGTDLASALEDAARRYQNLRAVVLMTDGDWNLGGSPMAVATRFRERDIPVFGVGVGSEQALPDLILEPVDVPSYGLIGEQIGGERRTSSTVIGLVIAAIGLLAAFLRLRTAASAKSASVAPVSCM